MIFSFPVLDNAKQAIHSALGEEVLSIERFPTGLCHYVYDVTTVSGRQCVLRMASVENLSKLESNVYWAEQLLPLGVPLARILHTDLTMRDVPFPFLILERLTGTDLGHVYPRLTLVQKKNLAEHIAAIQACVHTMPQGSAYGWSPRYGAHPFPSWLSLIERDIEKSRLRINALGVFDNGYADRLAKHIRHFDAYLTSVEPVAFLDDTTTKNVIVDDNGKLSGIVDVDEVCFGDPVFAIALTHMALLAHHLDTDYIGYWCVAARVTEIQKAALNLYTAICCLGFMAEVGRMFNQEEAFQPQVSYVAHLKCCFENLVQSL